MKKSYHSIAVPTKLLATARPALPFAGFEPLRGVLWAVLGLIAVVAGSRRTVDACCVPLWPGSAGRRWRRCRSPQSEGGVHALKSGGVPSESSGFSRYAEAAVLGQPHRERDEGAGGPLRSE